MPRLRNILTGEVIEIDPKQARLGKMRRRIWAWTQALESYTSQAPERFQMKMLTLTYRKHGAWKPNHIRDLMLLLRENAGGGLIGYAWVAELQRRGTIHYHVILVAEGKLHLPYVDKNGWWKHGSSRIEIARQPRYIMKYAQKGASDENNYPTGARIFSVWLSNKLQIGEQELRNWRISPYPKWVGDKLLHLHGELRARPAAGGGWRIGDEVVKSGYIFLGW